MKVALRTMDCPHFRDLDLQLDIVYIGTLLPHPGGSAIFNSPLLRGLANRGHRIRAIAPRANSIPEEAFRQDNPDLEEIVTYLVGPVPNVDPITRFGGADQLALEAEAIQPRVITWLESRPPNVVLLGRGSFLNNRHLASNRGIPSALIAHSSVECYGMASGDLPEEKLSLLREGYSEVDLIFSVAHHVTERLLAGGFTNVETVLAGLGRLPQPSDAEVAELAHELGVDRDAQCIIGHFSNLKPLKRARDIIDAAQLLKSPEKFRFLIVGDGPELGRLKARCQAAGLEDFFCFPGWIGRDRVGSYLSLCRAACMPSENEARSLAGLEALAAGKPLIATKIPAFEELVGKSGEPLLFPTGDVERLARLFQRVADMGTGQDCLFTRPPGGLDQGNWILSYEERLTALSLRAD